MLVLVAVLVLAISLLPNMVTESEIQRICFRMTKSQVRAILGAPDRRVRSNGQEYWHYYRFDPLFRDYVIGFDEQGLCTQGWI